jgi:UDP-glucuronate decarboxylase
MHPNDGRVVSNLIMQALRNEPITIYGDGSQTRSFCYADDLIDAMLRLMETPADFVGPVNVGNPVEITILELAEHILRLTGSASRIVRMPLPRDDPRQRRPNIELASRALQWQPKVALDDGLKETIAYFRRTL